MRGNACPEEKDAEQNAPNIPGADCVGRHKLLQTWRTVLNAASRLIPQHKTARSGLTKGSARLFPCETTPVRVSNDVKRGMNRNTSRQSRPLKSLSEQRVHLGIRLFVQADGKPCFLTSYTLSRLCDRQLQCFTFCGCRSAIARALQAAEITGTFTGTSLRITVCPYQRLQF